jgi:hypothetical protein
MPGPSASDDDDMMKGRARTAAPRIPAVGVRTLDV